MGAARVGASRAVGVTLDEALTKLGLGGDAFHRIKLARGVVGKTTSALLAVMTVFALAIAGLDTDWMILTLAVGGGVVFLVYLILILWFAKTNPGPALLEGAELIMWQRGEAAAKGQPKLPEAPPQADPARLPRGANDRRADEEDPESELESDP